MHARVFLNLPIKDLKRSTDFFGRLGFRFDPRFSDAKGACLVLGEESHVMLLVSSFFETFTPKPIADARRATESIIALALDSRAEVDRVVGAALQAGARPIRETQDHGFMYGRSFEDLDGHIWELFWMDPARLEEQPAPASEPPREMELTRIIDAPRDEVYAAWTDPDALRRWFGPFGFTLGHGELNLRVGSSYRFSLRGPSGKEHPFHGTWREVIPGELLAFTVVIEGDHGSEQLTTVHFATVGRRTRVTVRQTVPRHLPYARSQEQAWHESFARLGVLLEHRE